MISKKAFIKQLSIITQIKPNFYNQFQKTLNISAFTNTHQSTKNESFSYTFAFHFTESL